MPNPVPTPRVAGEVLSALKYNTDRQEVVDLLVAWVNALQIPAVEVSSLATGGSGTSGSPWTGWEAAVNALAAGKRLHFGAGYYTQTVSIAMKAGWEVFGDGAQYSRITVSGAIKGWTFTGASITTHAGLHIHHLGFYGNGVSTLALIDLRLGFHATVDHCYLFSSTTYALRASGWINLQVDLCDLENNTLAALRLGDAGDANGYCNDWTVSRCIFGGVGLATQGFLYIDAASACGLVLANAFEYGVVGITLQSCILIDIVANFFEYQTDNNLRANAPCSRIAIRHNHFHNAKQGARLDLNFSGAHAHESLLIEGNQHTAFGGSGHTSVTLFDPGATLNFRFVHNKLEPAANRGLLPTTYVAGYLPDNDANFTADVEKWSPAPVLNPGVRFGLAGTSHLRYSGTQLELAAVQATESLRLYGAASEILLDSAKALIKPVGANAAQFDNASTAGQTRMLLYDVDNGTLERVTVGAADSGGVGYKVLRIPN